MKSAAYETADVAQTGFLPLSLPPTLSRPVFFSQPLDGLRLFHYFQSHLPIHLFSSPH